MRYRPSKINVAKAPNRSIRVHDISQFLKLSRVVFNDSSGEAEIVKGIGEEADRISPEYNEPEIVYVRAACWRGGVLKAGHDRDDGRYALEKIPIRLVSGNPAPGLFDDVNRDRFVPLIGQPTMHKAGLRADK